MSGPRLTPEQQAVVAATGSVVVTAGAGTGKTELLAERFIAHLERDGLRPLAIVAVTFTERAALELRERIRRRLSERYADHEEWLAEVEAAPIGTLHSLCARICREHPEESGAPALFGVLDEAQSAIWLAEQLDDALSRAPEECFRGEGGLPFGQARDALWPLLREPVLAESALAVAASDDGLARWAAASQERVAAVVAGAEWAAAVAVLQSEAGTDKLEELRRAALRAAACLPDDLAGAAAVVAGLALRGGSKSGWRDFEGMKQAIRHVFEGVRSLAAEAFDADVDHLHRQRLLALRHLFAFVRTELAQLKRAAAVLDFGDLEVHALQALTQPAVRQWYRTRWHAIIVDECQDINPVQGQLLRALIAAAEAPRVTLVGDEKQSIYGFRGARPEVFRSLGDDVVVRALGGATLSLTQSFRSHAPLVGLFNQLFAPPVVPDYTPLSAHRQEPPGAGPCLELAVVEPDESKPGVDLLRRAEADYLARRIAAWCADPFPIWDQAGHTTRPVEPRDIALLGRSWDSLAAPLEALAAAGIPVVHAGGGDLLLTREASDAWALLRFLAVTSDTLALAAVLRAPWFAVDDRALLRLAQAASAQAGEAEAGWWPTLRGWSADPELGAGAAVLAELVSQRGRLRPTALLRLADELTGFSAVLSNLPLGDRRLADYQGFEGLVRELERGNQDVFAVTRRLGQLRDHAVPVSRPPLQSENAVTLLSIHGAKGLEWPVVVLPDLLRKAPPRGGAVDFDAQLGVALRLEGPDFEALPNWLGGELKRVRDAREDAETRRLLYVALTRARDRLLLTAAGKDSDAGGLLAALREGLARVGLGAAEPGDGRLTRREDPMVCGYTPARAVPQQPASPPLPPLPPAAQILLEPVEVTPRELPVSALLDYAECPRRFAYRYLEGHAEAPEWLVEGEPPAESASLLGTLVHWALEHDAVSPAELAGRWPGTPPAVRVEAIELADVFRQEGAFAAVRAAEDRCEVPIRCAVDGLTFTGRADRVGADYVVDYKTGRVTQLAQYEPQLWVYAQALGKPRALLADLRRGALVPLAGDHLAASGQRVRELVAGMLAGHHAASPEEQRCRFCLARRFCPDRAAAGEGGSG